MFSVIFPPVVLLNVKNIRGPGEPISIGSLTDFMPGIGLGAGNITVKMTYKTGKYSIS